MLPAAVRVWLATGLRSSTGMAAVAVRCASGASGVSASVAMIVAAMTAACLIYDDNTRQSRQAGRQASKPSTARPAVDAAAHRSAEKSQSRPTCSSASSTALTLRREYCCCCCCSCCSCCCCGMMTLSAAPRRERAGRGQRLGRVAVEKSHSSTLLQTLFHAAAANLVSLAGASLADFSTNRRPSSMATASLDLDIWPAFAKQGMGRHEPKSITDPSLSTSAPLASLATLPV